jgi:hypothetical protein
LFIALNKAFTDGIDVFSPLYNPCSFRVVSYKDRKIRMWRSDRPLVL